MPAKLTEFKYFPGKMELLITTSKTLDANIHSKATAINSLAGLHFVLMNLKTNEGRTSETTPPKYALSFVTRKLRSKRTIAWEARNNDPAAVWVEYGAHAGGRTFVLRYAPYRTALAAMEVV